LQIYGMSGTLGSFQSSGGQYGLELGLYANSGRPSQRAIATMTKQTTGVTIGLPPAKAGA